MKKKVLFVIPNLEAGGAEKSLISLLELIDYTKYEVDLLLFVKNGVFLNSIPKEVHLITLNGKYKTFTTSFFKAVFTFLNRLNFHCAFNRIIFPFRIKLINNVVLAEQKLWKLVAQCITPINKEYDVAIGYLEKSANYFVVDKTLAKKKIGWIHSDLEKMGINFELEKTYLKKLDAIVTVSDGLSERLRDKIPLLSKKIVTLENIISKSTLLKLAQEPIDITFDKDYFNIIFVGRLEKVKGLFLALEAIAMLLKDKYKVKWYLIGEGSEKEALINKATQNGIIDHINFLGFKKNPYPYIVKSDLFILPSLYEGKSIALEEAKILATPIVVTNFSSASDQITSGKNGLIADMTKESLSEKIKELIDNQELKKNIIINLKKNSKGNENEVQKFYKLIES